MQTKLWFTRIHTVVTALLIFGVFLSVMKTDQSVVASSYQDASPNPPWKILVLIYPSTDFAYSDGAGQHRAQATMTQSEMDRATAAATRFVETDIPALTSGYMVPLLTIRYPDHPLTNLGDACGYWPSRYSTSADLDPAFDSVIVIWDDSGMDLITGQPADLNGCGGLAVPNGAEQTYATFPVDSVVSNQRNVFKHEWGHSILFYFEAIGVIPLPPVNNHINDTTILYVHCPSGEPYILQDETDDHPIPNSIYNNESGFTHDYYSGTTAKPEAPTQCLGINAAAWSYGGPATKPTTNHNLLVNSGFEEGDGLPGGWRTNAWIPSNTTFLWDSTQKRSGSRSAQIVNSEANDAGWVQTVQVQSNANYLLSGWIKTENVAHTTPVDAGANLSVLGDFEHTPGVFDTTDWTQVSLQFNTGTRTQIEIAARLGMYSGTTTGTAWFDDLKLELLSPQICYSLSQSVSPAGSGEIVADPAPNCDNGTQYIHGTVVKLAATPHSDYSFDSWSGACSGTGSCILSMTAAQSVTAIFTVSASPAVPILLQPDQHWLTNTVPAFSWSSVPDTAYYEFVIARDRKFIQVIETQTISTTSTSPGVTLEDGQYYWRVRAYTVMDQPGKWSASRYFTLDTLNPVTPAPTSPKDGVSLRRAPTFRWTTLRDAVWYQFQIADNPDFLNPLYTLDQRHSHRRLPGSVQGTYFWRVRAQDAAGNWSDWSPASTITILPRR